MHYEKDTAIPDTTPPSAPINIKLKNGRLTWSAAADLQSGLAHFIVERDGKAIGTVPKQAKNRFGRPIFQGLQYSDTPAAPLVEMSFTDPSPAKDAQSYRVIAVNTVGLKSK